MMKQHRKLMAQLEAAEATARALYAAGANVEAIVGSLKESRARVAERIRAYASAPGEFSQDWTGGGQE
jgi:hypothetical protein